MNNTPLISILVPVYNCEPYLDKCISSIINQDYKNLQIVLANDGSTDNSLEICRNYAKRDSRISILTQCNKGVAHTRNDLLEQIRGEYFLFVDADDWIERDMVSYLLGLIIKNNAEIAVCANVKNNPSKVISTTIWNKKQTIEKFLYHKELNGSLCNKLIKTNLKNNIYFDPDIYYGEDALFTWKIFQYVNRIVISNKELYHYRPNLQSASHALWRPDRKGTNHLVWKTIVHDTIVLWPEFSDIAKARFGLEGMWSLYFASTSKYPYDENIKLRQEVIKANKRELKKYKIDGKSKYYIALILAYFYPFGRIIKFINRHILKKGI